MNMNTRPSLTPADAAADLAGEPRPDWPADTPAPAPALSFGEKAVGLSFNPSGDDQVAACKRKFAELIDQMNEVRTQAGRTEQARLAAVAITEMQGAQMWAVKALTWKD
jgi:hypothetical protein